MLQLDSPVLWRYCGWVSNMLPADLCLWRCLKDFGKLFKNLIDGYTYQPEFYDADRCFLS